MKAGRAVVAQCREVSDREGPEQAFAGRSHIGRLKDKVALGEPGP